MNIKLSGKNIRKFEEVLRKIKNYKKVKSIDVSNNNLKELPKNLTKLKNLTYLNISKNPIKNVY